MKQLLSLFLFLLPCLAWAQYPSNGNQKITLGEQTTADGLIWRGVLADTGIITPSSDTSAYIILDTVNHRFYNYNRATNVWSVAGGGTSVTTFSAGTTGLTPSTATSGAVTLGGTLAVANGGTGSATQNFVDLTTTQTVGGAKTFSNKSIFSSGFEAGNGLAGGLALTLKNTTNSHEYQVGYSTGAGYYFYQVYDGSAFKDLSMNAILHLKSNTNVGIATTSPTEKLHVVGNGLFTGTIKSGDITTNGDNKGIYFNGTRNAILGNTSPEEIRFATANADRVIISATGALTINNLSGSGSRGVNADANGVLSAASSILIKENVENINYGLSDVLKLKPVIFNYIDRNKWGEGKDLGFVAEDVMNVIPEATGVMNNSDIYFDLQKLVPVLTKAIQEQQSLIKALEQRIINLENK
jgi:hypothetical protein